MKYSHEKKRIKPEINNSILYAIMQAEGKEAADKRTDPYSLSVENQPSDFVDTAFAVCKQKNWAEFYIMQSTLAAMLSALRGQQLERNAQPETPDEADFLQNMRTLEKTYTFFQHATGFLYQAFLGPDARYPSMPKEDRTNSLRTLLEQTELLVKHDRLLDEALPKTPQPFEKMQGINPEITLHYYNVCLLCVRPLLGALADMFKDSTRAVETYDEALEMDSKATHTHTPKQ